MSRECIASITFGTTRYTQYPLREMSRQEAERLLCTPGMRHTAILRISRNAQQENPNLYYVVSYIPPRHHHPIHVIVTRESHEQYHATIMQTMPYPMEGYRLLLLPHHSAYRDTRVARFVREGEPEPEEGEPGR